MRWHHAARNRRANRHVDSVPLSHVAEHVACMALNYCRFVVSIFGRPIAATPEQLEAAIRDAIVRIAPPDLAHDIDIELDESAGEGDERLAPPS